MKPESNKPAMGLALCLSILQMINTLPAHAETTMKLLTHPADLSNVKINTSKNTQPSPEEVQKLRAANSSNGQNNSGDAVVANNPIGSFAGGIATGGGSSNSFRIAEILSDFGSDDSGKTDGSLLIKTNMKDLTKFIQIFGVDSKLTPQILDLIDKGLLEDIDKSNYVLESICVDDKGIERSASTQKVNLSNYPTANHPDVCINISKLARENATYEEIMGVLFHEHARHFGIEDTNKFDGNPIAAEIARLLKQFDDNQVLHWGMDFIKTSEDLVIGFNKIRPGVIGYQPQNDNFTVYSNNIQNVKLNFKNFQGDCKFIQTSPSKFDGAYYTSNEKDNRSIDLTKESGFNIDLDSTLSSLTLVALNSEKQELKTGQCTADIIATYDGSIKYKKHLNFISNAILVDGRKARYNDITIGIIIGKLSNK